MNLHVQSKSFSLTKMLKKYVNKKVASSINPREDYIQRVNVHLSDINGPHGGVDKRCHVHLVMSHMPDIVIRDTQENLYTAIDRAFSRAKVALTRKLSRRNQKFRQAYNGDFSQALVS